MVFSDSTNTIHAPTMPRAFFPRDDLDESSVTILSPPLSPHPKLVQPVLIKPAVALNTTAAPAATNTNNEDRVTASSFTPSANSIEIYGASPAAEPIETLAPVKEDKIQFGGLLPNTASSKVSKNIHSSSTPSAPLTSNAWTLFTKDPVGYFKRERSFLDLYPSNGPTWSNYVFINGAGSAAAQSAASVAILKPIATRPRGVNRRSRRAANVSSENDDSDAVLSSSNMVTRSSTRGRPRVVAADRENRPLARVSSTSQRPSSRPATPRAPVSRSNTASPAPSRVHDAAISQLVDYSPSISSLPAGKSLRAEWKGAPMDLSNDPNLHLLQAAEVHLASVLRLPVDIYLDSKKRLFAEKVHRLRQGLPFRRTDSQKACRIDVNKASRLFSAYERVGWLEDELFVKYL